LAGLFPARHGTLGTGAARCSSTCGPPDGGATHDPAVASFVAAKGARPHGRERKTTVLQFFKSRADNRRWNRRLVDDETRAFVEEVLDETSEIFRTASGEFQLRGLCLEVLASAATADLRHLKARGTDGDAFYHRELAPSWEGLSQDERASKIDQFIELSHMLGQFEVGSSPPAVVRDIVATVHVKVLLLAWAYDRTYAYMDRLFNGPLQYRAHRYRLAGGRVEARRG
jgi:hypothetical protein